MYMLSDIIKLDLLQRCFIVWVLGVAAKEKKERFALFFPLSVGLFIILIVADQTVAGAQAIGIPVLVQLSLYNDLLLSLARLIFCVLCLSVTYYLCCKVDLRQALYTGLAFFAIEKIGYDIFLLRDTTSFLSGCVTDSRFVWLEFVVLPICFLVINLQFLNELEKPGVEYTSKSVMFICSLLLETLLAGYIKSSNVSSDPKMVQLYCVNEITVYIGIFFIQSLYEEKEKFKLLATTELKLRQDQQLQYEMFEKNANQLNHKFHDFKHMVSALHAEENRQKKMLFIQDVEHDMAIYDSKIKTGNPALDTILTETILTCDQNNIQWTCLADGTALEFMGAVDLCRLVGNALDNAVESVLKIEEVEKRFLAINIWRRGGLSFIKISNYCKDIPSFENGIPLSTKLNKSEHGYGMQSIHMITEQYGGQYSVNIDHGIFTLNVLFPVTQKPKFPS